jgi:hypothetical protein
VPIGALFEETGAAKLKLAVPALIANPPKTLRLRILSLPVTGSASVSI